MELMEEQTDQYLFDEDELREHAEQDAEVLYEPDADRIHKLARAWTYHQPGVLERVDAVNSSVDSEIARLEAWREKEIDKATRGVRFLSNSIHKYCQETGQNLDTPYVKAKIKRGSERTEVKDPKAFCEAYKGTDYVTVKTTLSPAKSNIKAALNADVELSGATIERGPDSFTIEPVKQQQQTEYASTTMEPLDFA